MPPPLKGHVKVEFQVNQKGENQHILKYNSPNGQSSVPGTRTGSSNCLLVPHVSEVPSCSGRQRRPAHVTGGEAETQGS